MDDAYAIKSLKRVYDGAVRADADSAGAVVERFNETVELLQEEYPDNDVIQSIEVLTKVGTPGHWPAPE